MNANWYVISSIFLILIISTIILRIYKSTLQQRNYIELVERIRSWWFMIILFTIALMINNLTLILFFMYVSYLALKEYFTIIPTRQVDRRAIFIAYLSIPIQYLWVVMHWYGMFIIFIPVYLFILIPLRLVTLGQTKGYINATGTLHWGMMLAVYCVSYVAFLGVLPTGHNNKILGISYILFLIFLTQFNDVAQYCWGKTLGKHKIIPKVSPNKTVEGFIGGIVTTTILAVVLGYTLNIFTMLQSVFAGLIISICGFIGDVSMSAIKRDIGIKDTGTLLPGHGGILDRLDSLIFTAPVFFHFVRYFLY